MAIVMVRKPSETPNVRNIDDIIPFRFAYSNQNGYVENKANNLDYVVDGTNFTIKSGRVVLQGVESDIDANGFLITIENVAETRYYSVYYRVNLALNTTSIEYLYDTTTYPTINVGDDLIENTNGSANLELYKFKALNGIISDVEKVVQKIEYTNNVKVNNSVNSDKVNNLEILLDDNGVLTIGDIVIPQKKLIRDEELTFSSPTKIFYDFEMFDKTIEIEYSLDKAPSFTGFLKVRFPSKILVDSKPTKSCTETFMGNQIKDGKMTRITISYSGVDGSVECSATRTETYGSTTVGYSTMTIYRIYEIIE